MSQANVKATGVNVGSGKKASRARREKPRKGGECARREAHWARMRAVFADPEARRLVKLFSDANGLAARIREYKADHPATCRCRVCEWGRRHVWSPPNAHDYLTALHALICSASCIYEELPGQPDGD